LFLSYVLLCIYFFFSSHFLFSSCFFVLLVGYGMIDNARHGGQAFKRQTLFAGLW
jgi:hypothetical protein